MAQAESAVSKLDAARFVTSLPGFNLLTNSTSPSSAVFFVLLKKPENRGKVKDINAIQDIIRGKLGQITGGSFFVFSFPTVPGFSNVEALDFVLQDKTGGKLDKFSGVANAFIGQLMQKEEIAYYFSSLHSRPITRNWSLKLTTTKPTS